MKKLFHTRKSTEQKKKPSSEVGKNSSGVRNSKAKATLGIIGYIFEGIGNTVLAILAGIVKYFYVILNVVFIGVIACLVIGVILVAKVYPMYEQAADTAYDKLASLRDTDFRMHENTVIYDSKGKNIGEVNAGDYKYVNINDIGKNVQNAYIAVEDKHFKEHIGIDLQALTRAGLSLIRHNGEVTQGGSTITQQVVKNCLLTQKQTYERKLIEVMLAPRVEQMYSKAKIMEFYCDTCYYGNNCYGIETASQYYFGKPNKELSIAESAMLAGVSNSPNKYNPVASKELATKRRNVVLKAMLKQGYITQKQYEKASKSDIHLAITDHTYSTDNYMMSYALHCTALKLMEKNGFKFQYIFKDKKAQRAYQKRYEEEYTRYSEMIRSGGYSIYTTFNSSLQKKLQNTVDKDSKSYTETQDNGKYALQLASVLVDNSSGTVVAMVGGRGTKDQYNRGFLAKRQPGSSIKPLLVYAPGINEGTIVPSTIYQDRPITTRSGWSPKNSGGGYRGAISIREALARSLNTVAVQIYQNTGRAEAMSYLNKMHFSTLSYVDNYIDTVALGGFTNGVTPVDMAKGYATIAMNGQYYDRTCLKRVENDTDGTLYEMSNTKDKVTQVFSKDTAFEMQDMMQGTLREPYGTAHRYYNTKMIAGGKTGTTNANKDAWFSGYTTAYTCTVWVGYDSPKTMYGMYGASLPAKVWSDFMTSIPANMKHTDFDKPDTITLRHVGRGGTLSGKSISLENKGHKIWYECRTGGTDWYSETNKKVYKDKQNKMEQDEALDYAKKMTNYFLKYEIDTVDDAVNLDKEYNETMNAINDVDDEYKVSELRDKVRDQYDGLKETVDSDWKDAIDEYKQDEEKKKAEEAEQRVTDSENNAKETLKSNRQNRMEWYLSTLASRHYNDSATQLLLSDAETMLERIKGYSSYNEYATRLKTQKSRIKKLPSEPETPDIPEDSEDNMGINESQYDDSNEDIYEQQQKAKKHKSKKKKPVVEDSDDSEDSEDEDE